MTKGLRTLVSINPILYCGRIMVYMPVEWVCSHILVYLSYFEANGTVTRELRVAVFQI